MGIYKRDYHNISDEELMRRFKAGEHKAFDEIVNRYQKNVLNYLYKFTGDYNLADDIAQESFIRVFKYRDNFTDGMKFSPWLFTIVINRARSSVQLKSNNNHLSLNEFSDDELNEIEYYEDPEESENSEDEEYYQNLKIEVIKKAFEKLDETFREVILLRYDREFEYERISEVLNIPVGTVKSRINRGRAQLKQIINTYYNAG